MMKRLLIALLVLLPAFQWATAQTENFQEQSKLDLRLNYILSSGKDLPLNSKKSTSILNDGKVRVMISATDAKSVVKELQKKGIEARNYGDGTVAATVPVNLLREVAASDRILKLRAPRTMKLHMDSARASTKADLAHTGRNLDTPYTGKGVVVGIIDRGIDPGHLAFRDAKDATRVKTYWNQINNKNATTTIPAPGEGDGVYGSGGHGTHVASIAAGKNVGNNLHGIAPNADLYLVSCNLDEDNILAGVEAITSYAKENGQPCVINMSFGSHVGPHDGSTSYDRAADQYIGDGSFICASMGNNGTNVGHAEGHFSKAGEIKYLLINSDQLDDDIILGCVYVNAADGVDHLRIRPAIYGTPKAGDAKRVKSMGNKIWGDGSWSLFGSEIDEDNNRQCIYFYTSLSKLRATAKSLYESIGETYEDAEFCLQITALDENADFHAWTGDGYGDFIAPSNPGTYNFIDGDNLYCVGEGGASIPRAIAVGAYTSCLSWKSVNGSTYGYNNTSYQIGAIAPFSTRGPWLGAYLKPTIAAPGFGVKAAYYTYDGFDEGSLVSKVSKAVDGNSKATTFYYGVMQGTSMSCPVVTGAVALWLQAYPEMTHDELLRIFAESSTHDKFTGNEWNEDFGYGKLNVYEGLKMALRLADKTGIGESLNSEQPLSIEQTEDAWHLLFNNNESFANVELFTTDGKRVLAKRLNNVRRGNEETLSLSGLQAGVYLLHVKTTRASYTRKVIVK